MAGRSALTPAGPLPACYNHAMHRILRLLPAFAALLVPCTAHAQAEPRKTDALPVIAAKVATMRHLGGLVSLDWDAHAGRLYLEVTHLDAKGRGPDLLYTHSLPWGTGSNDLGLDRGQTSRGRIVHFERTGPKVLLVEGNQAFRSGSSDPAEQLAVTQSFPVSVLFGFKAEAEDPDGSVLVDATDFFVRDAHGVTETLTEAKQGSYKLDPTRSTIALDATRTFPKNTEVEAELTFTTDSMPMGRFVKDVTPDPHAITLRERQSFIELPPTGFTPRRFDPRAGYFPTSYRDYTTPLGEPLDQQFILHHRLLKKDPQCVTDCEPVTPIQYFVDPGAPEPIRSALLEGARWWNDAFTAAGWHNAFRVDILPADADPMDVRYNIIQWVHRYTRGWSYGAAVEDPRTGEIIKGNVTLGSLRGRQDYLIAEALLAPYKDGKAPSPANDPALAMVLQRIRQLAAHETGHTLGLAHNFAASAFGGTEPNGTSVMDYPQPWITLDSHGVPDLSHAYAAGIGAWDKAAIDYGYREFDRDRHAVEDPAALDHILAASEQRGLVFITDEDARPLGSAHPHAHLWDNGANATDELDRILTVRAAALARFGQSAIRTGTPLAQLEDTLVPLYLLHRYQTEAATKEIAGLDYRYSLRGDGQPSPALVPAAEQRRALTAVLKTLSPDLLTLPESLLELLPPRPPGLERTRESSPSSTGLTFDPIAAAEAAADLTLGTLFSPERANRLVEYHHRDNQQLSLADVVDATLHSTETSHSGATLTVAVKRAIDARIVEALLTLVQATETSSLSKAIVRDRLLALRDTLRAPLPNPDERPFREALAARIDQYEHDPAKFVPSRPVTAPPGMPIGDDEMM